MTDLQVSLNAGEIIGAIVSIAASYVAWSAKKVLSNLETALDDHTVALEKLKERMDRFDKCLLRICIHHRKNHDEELACE